MEAFGRLAGFTNPKPQRRLPSGLQPFARLRSATGHVYSLIKYYSNSGIAFMVDQDAFAAIVKTAPDTPFKSPETLAHFLALSSILPIVQGMVGSSETVDIVFDRNLVHRKQAEAAYQQLFTWAPDLAALLARKEPRFEDDEDFMPLQAADLLAHCVWAYHNPDPKYDRVRNSPVCAALRGMKNALIPVIAVHMQYWRDRVEKGIPKQTVMEPKLW